MKKIFAFFIFLFIFLFIIFTTLKIGFSISSLNLDFLRIEQLYIKLDKKLVIKAKKIIIFDNKIDNNSNFTSKDIIKLSKNIRYVYKFIQEIDILDLQVNNQKIKILFKDNEFHIDDNRLSLILDFQNEDENINVSLKNLILKDYNADIKGNIKVNTKNDICYFDGYINSPFLNSNIKLTYNKDIINYDLSNLNISNLPKLINKISNYKPISNKLKTWLVDNISSSMYHFDFISGKININKIDFYFDDIKANGYIKDIVLKINPNAPLIKIPYSNITLNNQRIDFNFKKASIGQYDISESKVFLYSTMNTFKNGININIKSDEVKLDNDIKKMLEFYNIKLPLTQLSGTIKSNLILDIPFYSNNIKYDGVFELKDTKIDLADFYISKGKVILKKDEVILNDFSVKNSFLDGDLDSIINFKNKNGKFNANIKKLYFENILNITNQKINLDLSYIKDTILSIKDFDLDMNFKDGLKLNIKNLAKLKKYSSLMQALNIKDAKSMYLNTKDFKNFDIKINDAYFDLSLFTKDNKTYNNDNFDIKINPKNIKITSDKNHINATIDDKNININVKSLLYKYSYDNKESNSYNLNKNLNFNINDFVLEIVNIDKKIIFDEANIQFNSDNFKLNGKRFDAKIDIFKNPHNITLKLINFKDQNINEIFNKNVVKDGNFNLTIEGANIENFDGKIWFSNSYIKNMKFANQLISFIDTIPSLILFKSPTFNEEGLLIEKGIVNFERKNNIINIKALDLRGDSVDILGLGSINLDLNTINLDLELQTLKSASSIISKVPIINQVILGKNKQISTIIKVDGHISEPKFHTQLLKDIITSPFKLLRNITEIPTSLFE